MPTLHIKGKLFYLSIINGIDGLNATESEQEIEKITEKLIYCKVTRWPDNRTYKKTELDSLVRTWAGYEVVYTDRNKRNDYVTEIVKKIKKDQEEKVDREALRLAVLDRILRRLKNNKNFDVQSIRIKIDDD